MTAKIKLNAASGGGSVSIVAPSSTTSNANVELKLPIADGSSDQVIKTDGSGNLSFGQAVTAKSLTINGAMIVAQRGVSSTADGYLIDMFNVFDGGVDEACTREQVDVASGTTPYSLGFRKALRVTNGNQTSGADANDNIQIIHRIEAQDIANSGWNYTSASSFITFQFWVKSSVAQNFYVYFRTKDGTEQRYVIETGSLSANTWTKVIKTIPGNSNLQFDNNSDSGLEINIAPFWGSAFTDSGVSLNAWAAYATGTRTPDYATTWYTTNDATFEVTGVQLEVGSSASAFAHESYGETLAKCQRYLFKLQIGVEGEMNNFIVMARLNHSTGSAYGSIYFPCAMRVKPTFTYTGGAYSSAGYTGNPSLYHSSINMATISGANSIAANGVLYLRRDTTGDLDLLFSAEL
tara:strand:+ start:1192 stop:2412 length:1221 start_codon:yes stop_codon:yes gene_type:complete